MKPLLNTEEAAELLGVHPNKIYSLRKTDPSFPYHNLNGVIRYVTEELIEWVKGKAK